jgi:ABC-type sulfate transport system permease component
MHAFYIFYTYSHTYYIRESIPVYLINSMMTSVITTALLSAFIVSNVLTSLLRFRQAPLREVHIDAPSGPTVSLTDVLTSIPTEVRQVRRSYSSPDKRPSTAGDVLGEDVGQTLELSSVLH